MNQENLQNGISNDFFAEIDPITHCLNICMILNFDLATHSIKKTTINCREEVLEEHVINNLEDFNCLTNFIKNRFLINKDKELLKEVKEFFHDFQVKHSQLTLPPENVKLVLIIDIADANRPYIKHWTSLPVMGNSNGEVQDYFRGVFQLGKNTLTLEEQEQLAFLIDKITDKILGKV